MKQTHATISGIIGFMDAICQGIRDAGHGRQIEAAIACALIARATERTLSAANRKVMQEAIEVVEKMLRDVEKKTVHA